MPLRSVATLEERPRGLMAWHGAWGAETQAIRLPDSLGLALLGGGGGGGGDLPARRENFSLALMGQLSVFFCRCSFALSLDLSLKALRLFCRFPQSPSAVVWDHGDPRLADWTLGGLWHWS